MAGLRLCCSTNCAAPLRIIEETKDRLVFEVHPERSILAYGGAGNPCGPFRLLLVVVDGRVVVLAGSIASLSLCCLPCLFIARSSSIERYEFTSARTLTVTKVRGKFAVTFFRSCLTFCVPRAISCAAKSWSLATLHKLILLGAPSQRRYGVGAVERVSIPLGGS
jgi:hypothetical protein